MPYIIEVGIAFIVMKSLFILGMVFTKQQAPEKAIADFSRALTLNPDHANAAFARAACYNTIGQFSKAIEDYNVALLKDQRSSSNIRKTARSTSFSSHRSPKVDRQMMVQSEMDGSPRDDSISRSFSSGSASQPPITPAVPNTAPKPSRRPPPPPTQLNSTQRDTPPLARSISASGAQAAEELHERGYEMRKQGKYAEAIELYSEALQHNRNYFKALFNRGFAYDKLGNHAAAVDDYSSALKIEPNNAYALYNRGISQERLGNVKHAKDDIEAALRILPNNLDFRFNYAFCLKKLGDFSDAVLQFNKTIQLNPSHMKALYHRGLCYEALNQWETAMDDFIAVLEKQPLHGAAMVHLALALENTNSTHDAMKYYRKALDVLRTADSLNPGHDLQLHDKMTLYSGMARIYEKEGRLEEAIAELSTAIAQCNDKNERIPVCLARAALYKASESYDNAIRDISSALICMNHDDKRRVSAFASRGFCYRKLGDYHKAVSDFGDVLNIDRQNISALNSRAYCLAKLGELRLAVQDYTQVIQVDPSNSHAFHNRGILLDKLGLSEDAIFDFSRVLEIDSGSATTSTAKSPRNMQHETSRLSPHQQSFSSSMASTSTNAIDHDNGIGLLEASRRLANVQLNDSYAKKFVESQIETHKKVGSGSASEKKERVRRASHGARMVQFSPVRSR